MLTEQQFRDEIRGFVDKMNENNFHWQLKEVFSNNQMLFRLNSILQIGKYARETHLKTLSDGRVITSETHILYNSTYQVPTIWFNFFENSWFY